MIPGMISPERLDYFADGKYTKNFLSFSFFQCKKLAIFTNHKRLF
jgi:hypothetical protein